MNFTDEIPQLREGVIFLSYLRLFNGKTLITERHLKVSNSLCISKSVDIARPRWDLSIRNHIKLDILLFKMLIKTHFTTENIGEKFNVVIGNFGFELSLAIFRHVADEIDDTSKAHYHDFFPSVFSVGISSCSNSISEFS